MGNDASLYKAFENLSRRSKNINLFLHGHELVKKSTAKIPSSMVVVPLKRLEITRDTVQNVFRKRFNFIHNISFDLVELASFIIAHTCSLRYESNKRYVDTLESKY